MPRPMEPVKLADRIRRSALENYVRAAGNDPNDEIRIRAGDIHRDMRLAARMPAVCAALDSAIFRREGQLELVQRSGPPQGANVEWIFRRISPREPPIDLRPSGSPPLHPEDRHINEARPHPGASGKYTFTLRGNRFEKDMDDFVTAIAGHKPGRIQKYSIVINGTRYPIRQVVSCGTGLPPITITSQEAYRILEKLGFSIDIDNSA